MPPTIEQNGRIPSHPSKNVILDRGVKSKRSVHCTIVMKKDIILKLAQRKRNTIY